MHQPHTYRSSYCTPYLFKNAEHFSRDVNNQQTQGFCHHGLSGAGLQPSILGIVLISWGVAPGWYGTRLWRLVFAIALRFRQWNAPSALVFGDSLVRLISVISFVIQIREHEP
jgi:hypothetical protein